MKSLDNFSIVTARNLGIQKRDRQAANFGIEAFLLKCMDLHGLNKSDIANIALEKYLKEKGYLTPEILAFMNTVTDPEKTIFTKGIIE
jgi:hypothetical protein